MSDVHERVFPGAANRQAWVLAGVHDWGRHLVGAHDEDGVWGQPAMGLSRLGRWIAGNGLVIVAMPEGWASAMTSSSVCESGNGAKERLSKSCLGRRATSPASSAQKPWSRWSSRVPTSDESG